MRVCTFLAHLPYIGCIQAHGCAVRAAPEQERVRAFTVTLQEVVRDGETATAFSK